MKPIGAPHLIDTEDIITPRAAAQDACLPHARAQWILSRALLIVIGGIPIGAPLKHVTRHVV